MSNTKSSTLNVRISPSLKEALRVAAMQDHRSISNLLEKMIINHCKENGITIPEQQDLFDSEAKDGKANG
ncbi:MAG: putative HicB family RNase H-like nuclease [Glaciecola sp.]|jgi:predicted HicB family RNase H-like nuclease